MFYSATSPSSIIKLGRTVCLVLGDTVDVDDPLLTVDGSDLALTALEGTTNDHDLVILADGDGTGLNIIKKQDNGKISRLTELK